ncbi:MATE family efflux transporter [Eubacteriales bacterium OttesenSCG-928-N13]|nr:MATE family efflux transporter [Eubacteriales bacterium OttesenSCG-928-N13]
MSIRLSDHFTYKRLFRFVLPTIIMMVIGSVYSIVDGFFVSNFIGKNAFAAVNLIMPIVMAAGAAGFMIGTGGSALVAKTLGEGDTEKANRIFSMLVYVLVLFGIAISVIGFIFLPQLARMIGADDTLIDDCVLYGRILLAGNTAFMLQNCFQSFLIVAEKPKMGLTLSIAGGITNVMLDYLFIYVFGWGVAGAAVATMLGQMVSGLVPLFYFLRKNDSLLRLTKPVMDLRALGRSCANGSSEMVTSLSSSLIGVLYNYRLIQFAGADGISAYGVIMYVNFIFLAMFLGYSVGSSPVVSYHYGAGNQSELKNLFKKSMVIISVTSVAMRVLSQVLALPLAKIFVGYDQELLDMTHIAFRLYSTSFLLCGFNIFGSGFFTALNNGLLSAVISFMRTLVVQVIAVLVMPMIFGINGIWLALTVAEGVTLIVTVWLLISQRKRYQYA